MVAEIVWLAGGNGPTDLASTAAERKLNGIIGLAVAISFVLLIVGIHQYRRWDLRRRAKRAPSPDIQAQRIAMLFNGIPIATVDPRDYTIPVAQMNVIANSFGYYYIGERGHRYGSTEVAFQSLPAAPPLPIPRKTSTWIPVIVPQR